jgi:hypothetical protein
MAINDSAQQAEGIDISASQADEGEVDSQSHSTTDDVENVDVKALQSELEELRKRAAKAEHEAQKARRQAAARRVEAKEAQKTEGDGGAEKSNSPALPEDLRETVEGLRKALAKQQAAERAQVRAAKAKVQEQSAGLPSELQAAIKYMPPKEALAWIENYGKRKKVDTPAPSKVSGDGAASASFRELSKTMTLDEIAQRHPEVYKAALAKTRRSKTTSIGRLLGRH